MAKEYKFGFIITGDAESGKKAVRAVRQEIEGLEKQTHKNKSAQSSWTAGIDEFNKRATSMSGLIKTIGGALGATLTVNYFAGLVKNSIDAADHLNDLSKSTGLNVKTLAGLQLAAKQTGGELDGTAKAINMLAKRMGEDSDKFRKLGITAREPLEAFKQLSDQFVAIQDPQKRAAFGAEALGKSWEAVAPLLAEGSANIQTMVDKGARMSGVTQEMAEKADAFNDNLELLKASTAGWTTAVAGAMLPALTGASEWLFKVANSEEWLALKTEQATAKLQEQTEALKDMTSAQVDAALQKTFAEMEKLRGSVAAMTAMVNTGAGSWAASKEELQAQAAQLEATEKLYASLKEQLAVLEGRAQAVAVATSNVATTTGQAEQATVAQASATEDLNRIYAQSAVIVSNTADAYVELMRTSGAAIPTQLKHADIVRDLDAIYADAGRAAMKYGDQTEKAARDAEADWRQFRDSLGNMFADTFLDPDGNFFDRLGRSFKTLFAKVAGDLMASGIAQGLGGQGGFSLAGTLSGAGTAGQLTTGLLSRFAPSLASSLGIGGAVAAGGAQSAASYVALMESSGAAFGGGAAGASTGLMAGLKGALTSIPGWGWALAGAAALTMMFDKKSTPSWNAGFLTDPSTPLGKSGQSFSVSPFASGFQPLGFYRRSSQSEAEQVIDLFRALDDSIVGIARNAGLTASLSTLRGLNETLLAGTSGTVFGAGGEDGKPGMAIQQQLQMFASQLIESLRGQIEDRDLDMILSAGGVDQMIAKLQEVLDVQQQVADAMGEVAAAQQDAVLKWQNSVAAASDYLSDVSKQYLEEQEALIRNHWQTQMEQARELHGRQFALFRSLMDYTKSLRLGDLTTLSPRQQFELAQTEFRSLAATANNTGLSMTDRLAAAEKLQAASGDYLTAGRSMFASSGQYKEIFTEVLNALDAAKFLGTTGTFDPTPYESAMLAELKKIAEGVDKLPAGMAAALMPIMANLINQGLLAGKSKEFIANTVTGLGGDAVAAADMYLGRIGGGSISDYATSADTIRAYADAVRGQSSNEAQMVEALVAKAKEYGLSANTVGDALGLSGSQTQDILRKYGIPGFAAGGVHDGGWRLVGERGPELEYTGPSRIYSSSESRAMMGESKAVVVELQALRRAVDNLVRATVTGSQIGSEQMQEQTAKLEQVANKLQGAVAGSRNYVAR